MGRCPNGLIVIPQIITFCLQPLMVHDDRVAKKRDERNQQQQKKQ